MALDNPQGYGNLVTPVSAEQQLNAATGNDNRTVLTPSPVSIDAQKVAGTPKTGPGKGPADMSFLQKDLARVNGIMLDAYKPDENKFNKLTTYNSSHYGQNFERFYYHPKFKQLGFSPFRNNEEFYNKNSSLWHDTVRGGAAFTRLAGLGFSSTFSNWGSFLSDKPDTEGAEEMERLMSIGSSSREGFGAKALNFGVNAGYTYGVMAEILAEEVALIAATAVTGGGAGGLAVVRTGTNVGRAFKALKLLTKVDDARQAWKVAKVIGGGVREALPLSQTTALLTRSGKAAAKWDSLDNMAKISKTFGSFYRDLREINAVTSEAKLEGGMVQNDVTNQLMAKFRKDNNREPSLAEAKAIGDQASKAGYLASQTNMAGIYVSNKIVLDRALKGIPGLQNLEKAVTKGKAAFIFNKDWKKLAKDPYSMVRGAKKYFTPAYYKQVFNPKNLGKGGFNYLSANLMEGTQEVYQEAVAKGITDYYVNTYNNPNLAGSGYFRTMMESGLKSQMSDQGLETFLSGFLMAGPMTMAQSAFYKGYDAVRMKKLKNQAQKFSADPANAGKENPYQTQIDRELEFDQKTLEAMNEVTKDPAKYINALEKDLKIQRDLALAGEQAALDGDMKFARDTRDASLISHSIQLLNAGRFDVFQDQLKGLRGLSKEELQEAFGEDPGAEKGTVQDRLEKVIERTNQIKDAYEEYQNTVNPYSLKDQPEDYVAFEQMRSVMISNDMHFKFVANRMTNIYNEFTNTLPFQNASVTDFAPLFSIGAPSSEAAILRPGMRAEIEMLTKEIEGLGDRPENAAKKEQLTKKRDSLEALSGLSQLFLSQYLATQKVSQNEQAFIDNSEALEATEELFKDSFFKHIKLLAEQNGQVVLDKDIEKTYQLYKDYWKLSGDKAEYANAINAFANPQMFAQMRGRVASAIKAAMAVRKEKLQESLATYKKKYLTNNFLNDLFEKFNAFVDPDEAQAFLDDKEIPVTFYNADTLEEIEMGSEAYKGIMALIDEYDTAYFEETGKRFIRNVEGYLASFRGKIDSDKRTMNDLGEEFGFDPTSRTTQVDIRQVLQAVIKSKFADKDLKKLAQVLSTMIPEGTQVTFKMDHHTNSTFDEQNGIIVDPRFSAEGYSIGVAPIEFSIMNATMQMVVSEALVSDPVFDDAISKLREKLSADVKDPIEKKLLSLALASNRGFVAEVMTSPLLQQKLESIPLTDNLTEQTEEAKTLWGSFIEELKNLLNRLFGNDRAPSLYDEAIIIVTNKLSQPGVAPSITAEEDVETDEQVVTEEDPALEELLKAGFQEALAELEPNERLGMRYESWKLTSPLAADIIKKYQANKVKQTVAKQGAASVPALTEEERKRIITDLGYTVEEMNNMGEAEVDEIIKEKRKKKLTLKRVSGDVEIDFDEFLPAEAVVENAIRDLKIKLQKADFKVFEEKDPKTGKVIDSWYAQANARGEEIPGTRHERVSNVVKEKGDFAPGAADRGTVIDELLRDYLNGDITNIIDFKTKYNSLRQQYPSAIFSEDMLNQLFDRFRTVQRQIKSLGLRVDARIPTLYGVLGPKMGTTEAPVNVAGSIDILAFNSLGEVFIIDLKTSTQDRRAQYKLETDLENEFGERYPEIKDAINAGTERFKSLSETINSLRVSPEDKVKLKKVAEANPTEDNIFFYKAQDEAQQNAYAELLKQVSGIEVKGIVIFPLKVTKVGKTFTSVNFQKNAEGKYTMYVKGPGSTNIYDITGRENVITEYPENPISKEKLDELFGKGTEETTTPTTTAVDQVEIERRKKLSGWNASYELAAIAKAEGVDLSKLSREEYADYAIKNHLKIDDSQLRANPKQRNGTSVQEVVDMLKADRASLTEATKNAFDSFFKAMMAIVNKPQTERYLAKNVRLLGGTKDSNSWLFFSINNGTNDGEPVTHKSYFSLKNLNDFSPEVFKNFMVELQKRGYNGGVKIFQDLEVQGPALSDQVVMHGYSEADAKLALEVAKEFYGDKLLESSYGKDEVINGKNMSYSQILSDKIKNQVDSGNIEPIATTPEPTSTPTDIEVKKADIERRSGESSTDFINRLFKNNYFVEVDGKQLFSLAGGRWGVIVNVNGITIPFYQSTSGTDTKITGQWYPFFGDLGNWVIKGNSDDSNLGYGFKAIQDVQSFLNANIKETDAFALSDIVPTEINQNKEDFRKLNESQIKSNNNLSISKKATAKRLSELMGYTVEEANKTKSDAELFALASKKVFAELAALEGTTTEKQPTGEIITLPIQNGEIVISGLPTDSFSEHWTFKVKDGKLVSGIYETYFQGEYGDRKTSDTITDLEDIYKKLSSSKRVTIRTKDTTPAEEPTGGTTVEPTGKKTGTQTQMDFDEFTLNIGDRVKVNTLKDGEGIIKEDRGDKVLLEDGRQIMKKNLTKVTTTDTEAPKSIVTPELQGKVIYVSPSTESTTKLSAIPGVIYGNTIFATVAIGEFDDDLINKLRAIANDPSAPWNIQEHARTIVNAADNGITPDQVKDINSAITNLSKPGVISGTLPTIIKTIQSGILDKVIAKARELADAGATVIFDNNAVAASDKIDLAFVSAATDMVSIYGKTSYYRDAIKAISKSKLIKKPLGKSIVDIITGVATPDIQVSDAFNNLIGSIETAGKNTLSKIEKELKGLKKLGMDESVLQEMGLTLSQVEEAISKRKEFLQNTLDINDLAVNDIVMYKKQADSESVPGMIIKKEGDTITVAPISLNEQGSTNESLGDLFNRSEVSTFTAGQVPDFISPMTKQKAPVTPDPDVKAQSDVATQEANSTPAEQGQRLKDNLNADPTKTAQDAVNEFLDGLCNGKNVKKQ